MSGKFIQEREQISGHAYQEAIVDELLAEWAFFLPSVELVEDILRLNDQLGGAYFDREYESLVAAEGRTRDAHESPTQDGSWLRRLIRQASEVIFHEDERGEERLSLSEEESVAFFQKFLSERVYNHLAMLSRSPHAEKRGAFSIREELTEEIAEKLGLGLALHRKTSPELRAEAEGVLLRLADEFERWFVEEQKGIFPTAWGEIYAAGKEIKEGPNTLILLPDVSRGMAFATGRSASAQRAALATAK